MKKKRIAFLLGSMGRGGAERVISILSKEYAACGWDTDIALLLSNTVDYILDDTTRILDFSGSTSGRLMRAPMWLKSIRSYVKKEKPDVVVAFTARINVMTLLACMGLKTKTVISERNDPRHDGRGFVTKLLTKLLYPSADAIVFQTNRAKVYFNEKIQKKSEIIPNPIMVNAEAIKETEKKIVSVGRLASQKNQLMLIEAFYEVAKKHPDYTLYIYGEGNLRQKLTERIEELNLSGKVFLPGNILNLHEKIADAQVFALPSDYEGLSNALLEAMTMGLPCVSTSCAGADEYIENEKNGLLVPVGDTKAMEKALLYMIENPQKRVMMGCEAKKASQSFSSENILKVWHSVID